MKPINDNEEQTFEAELFHSLKVYGYLFPENVQEVEVFEQSHDLSLETPSVQTIFELSKNGLYADYVELEMGLAAYSDPAQEFPELLDNELPDDEKESK